MKNGKLEKMLDKLGGESVPDDVHGIAEEKTRQFTDGLLNEPKADWRTIIKSGITKFAAAAAIMIGALGLFMGIFHNGATPAYAIEQTIAAINGIKYFHLKQFGNPPKKPLFTEAWLEYGPDGKVKNMRFDTYQNDDKINESIAWKEGKTQAWTRDVNELQFFEDTNYTAKILFFASRHNPKGAIEYMAGLEKEGKVKIQIEEPTFGQDEILVSVIYEPNTYLLGRQFPAMKDIYHVDRYNKLIKAVDIFELDPNGFKPLSGWEYCDYNQPIAPEIFDLDKEAPSDVKRIDVTAMNNGIEQGDLNEKEIAIEVTRQFLDALVNKDYLAAGKLWRREISEEQSLKQFGKFHIQQVISIGEPTITGYMSWDVPAKVQIEKDGKITERQYTLNISRVLGHPTRWAVDSQELK
jgi:hypothetical protein